MSADNQQKPPQSSSLNVTQPEVVPDATQLEAPAPGPTRWDAARVPGDTVLETAGERTWQRLPAIIAKRFALEREFDATGGEADGFLVRAEAGRLFAKVYRKGRVPNSEVLERLNRAAPAHVIRLIEAGYSESDGCHYELLEYAEQGTLADLVRSEGKALPIELVRHVLVELHEAIRHVHSLGIEHRDIKPDNILVRARSPLDLVLTDFGIASAIDETKRFTSRNRTVRYSPPEALSGVVHRTRWDYWSLGIVLVELLTGQNPFGSSNEQVVIQRLVSYPTDELVEGVKDPAWRKLCRGLLRRSPEQRWAADEIEKWLRRPDDPSLIIMGEAAAADATTQVPPYMFLGRAYRSVGDLAQAFGANWAAALKLWKTEQPALIRWLRHDLGLTRMADVLEALDKDTGRAAGEHAQLFVVILTMAPDAPASFQGRPVSAAGILGMIAESVKVSDPALSSWLVQLHKENILSLAAQRREGGTALAALAASWNSAIDEYKRLGDAVRADSGGGIAAPPLDDASLAQLLSAATPDSEALDALRSSAARVSTEAVETRLWYSNLGDPRTASAAGALLMLRLAPAAEGEVEAARQVRRQRNNALWTQIALGVGVGAVVGGVWWGAVDDYCRGGASSVCAGYPTAPVGSVAIVFVVAAAVAAIATLWAVDAQTASRS